MPIKLKKNTHPCDKANKVYGNDTINYSARTYERHKFPFQIKLLKPYMLSSDVVKNNSQRPEGQKDVYFGLD